MTCDFFSKLNDFSSSWEIVYSANVEMWLTSRKQCKVQNLCCACNLQVVKWREWSESDRIQCFEAPSIPTICWSLSPLSRLRGSPISVIPAFVGTPGLMARQHIWQQLLSPAASKAKTLQAQCNGRLLSTNSVLMESRDWQIKTWECDFMEIKFPKTNLMTSAIPEMWLRPQ